MLTADAVSPEHMMHFTHLRLGVITIFFGSGTCARWALLLGVLVFAGSAAAAAAGGIPARSGWPRRSGDKPAVLFAVLQLPFFSGARSTRW